MKTMTPKKLALTILTLAFFGLTNVAMACTASFTSSIGVNGHATFTSTSTWSTGYPHYQWDAGDGSGLQYGSSTFNHIYTANGAYWVKLILTIDTVSCTSVDSALVTVSNVTTPCTLAASYTYSAGAHGLTSFASTSTGTNAGTLYFWNFGDGGGKTLSTAGPTHTYIYQGYYTVWLYIEDTGSAYCEDSVAQNLLITTADSNACHFKANFTYVLNANGHVAFTNTTTGLTTYMTSTWNPGDASGTTTLVTNSYNHIYTANGTYNVTLVVDADSNMCRDSITLPVVVNNVTTPCSLSANFTATNDTAAGEITLISTSTGTNGSTQYYWRPYDSAALIPGTDTLMYNYAHNGTYNVTLIIMDTGSAYCVDSITMQINISNRDSLHASFTSSYLGDSISIGYEYYFQSTSTGVNGVTMYRWAAGDTTAADSGVGMTTFTHYYTYPGTHTATLSIWFTKYPRVKPHNMMGTRYDFSTYSETITVGKPTGIATISNESSGLGVYPTPNDGQFKLALAGIANGTVQIEVINVLGETISISTVQVNNGKLNKDINLQNIPNGMYFVKVATSTKVYTARTIVSNR